ncbi:hypothetical protein PR202_ga06917 [Eleusine coracana subsp. coracana]|uniref:Uncharacterized protein n=1 Tax=Eleusine coracana subsp. coracana TaxID=191504 RepID=A0AAV5BX99_ELECO|nr:hypothetical protein PR202_ga06917 [Eleusine coracana subsp. coracana]
MRTRGRQPAWRRAELGGTRGSGMAWPRGAVRTLARSGAAGGRSAGSWSSISETNVDLTGQRATSQGGWAGRGREPD